MAGARAGRKTVWISEVTGVGCGIVAVGKHKRLTVRAARPENTYVGTIGALTA